MTAPKRLTRDKQHAMIAGVCSGLAKYLDIDPTVMRVAYVLLSIFTAAFPGILVYVILWIVMPAEEPQAPLAPGVLPQQR